MTAATPYLFFVYDSFSFLDIDKLLFLFSPSGPICTLHRAHNSRNVGQGLSISQVHLGAFAVECVHFLRVVHELLHSELQEETYPGAECVSTNRQERVCCYFCGRSEEGPIKQYTME